MPQVFGGLVREHVAPAMKQHGLRRQGRTTWWERRPSGGWVLLVRRNDKWNSTEAVQRLTEDWVPDPRPITLRAYVERWRADAGLPPVDLPTFWSPSMLPTWRDRFPTAQDAFRAGVGTKFLYADGTESADPPPGWLEAAPPTTPAAAPLGPPGHRRRWPLARWSRRDGAEKRGNPDTEAMRSRNLRD
jgi:hypothetical protein